MFKSFAPAILLAFLLAPLSLEAASPVFKCTINGSVAYQNSPCPSGESRKPPTVEQLNADRQKRLQQAGNAPTATPAPSPGGQLSSSPGSTSVPPALNEKARPNPAVSPAASLVESFKCDGRVHCSQMNSCSEAKYFLRNCPGVKMDGDGNGIPCEKQWCNR